MSDDICLTPQPPADGEVAELVAKLRRLSPLNPLGTADPTITRAAALLERLSAAALAVVPVPVSERLPGVEDCTAQGWCWVFYRGFATWTLEPPLGQDGKHTGYTHWLPANALPLPSGEV